MASGYEGDSHDLRIVLLGVCEAGKSSTGNAILGREAFKERGTRESEIQRGRVDDRNISIIDTPGFFNTQLTDEEMKQQMMKSLYLAHPGPHMFLLIINLEDFEKDKRNIVEQIQDNFEAQSFKFTLVLFIGREKISKREWMLLMLNRNFQELVSHFRDKYHVINSKREINPTHITELLKKIDEIIKQNDNQHYNNEIYLKSLIKRGKERQNQEEEKEDRKNEQEKETKQEQIKIVWNRFKMDSVTEDETTKAFTELEKQSLISQVSEARASEEWVQVNKNNENNVVKQLAKSLAISFESMEELQPRYQKNSTKMSGNPKVKTQGVISELRIVMVGKTGVGKSATGNTILRQNVFKEELCSESVTKTCQQYQQKVGDQTISLTDTPGLCDTQISESQLKKEIMRCVEMSVPGPHAFLLVLRLDSRYTDEEKNTVKWIQDNFGKKASHYTIILFTRGDQLDTSIEDFLTKNHQLNDLVKECKGGYHVLNNKDDRNPAQVTELIEKIQRMVKKNGGEYYTNEMYKEAQKKRILRKVKDVALVGASVAGVAGAVAGGAALVAATGGVALPIMLVAGGTAVTTGTSGKFIADKVKDYNEKRRNSSNNT